MKKLLLVSALLALGMSAYAKEVISAPVETVEPVVAAPVVVAPVVVNPWSLSLRAGSDVIWSEYDSADSDRDGWEVGAELSKFMDPHWSLGLGAMYQSFGENESEFSNSYNSVPVYATAKYYFSDVYEGVRPYIKGNLGYAFNSDGNDDGMYWAAGAGVEYNNFFTDIMYQNTDSNDDYSRVTLGLGYNFNF